MKPWALNPTRGLWHSSNLEESWLIVAKTMQPGMTVQCVDLTFALTLMIGVYRDRG